MTRDETLALFLECEAKRSQVRAAALAEGRNEDEAREIAHEAAKAHWNAWADRMLTEKKALEIAGDWAVWSPWRRGTEPKNSETRAWMTSAKADFSQCIFLTVENKGKATEQEEAPASLPLVQLDNDKSISVTLNSPPMLGLRLPLSWPLHCSIALSSRATPGTTEPTSKAL